MAPNRMNVFSWDCLSWFASHDSGKFSTFPMPVRPYFSQRNPLSIFYPNGSSVQRVGRFVLAFVLALGISLFYGPMGQAQIALPDGFGQSAQVGPPAEVTRYGNLETISVDSPLSFTTLFTIASPTVYDRSPDALEGRQTVEQRAEEIAARLLLLLNRPMDPDTLVFEVSTLNNVRIIEAQDDTFTQPLVLMSVTELDAQFNGLPVDSLAEQWRDTLEQELRIGLTNLPADRRRVRHIVLGLLLLTGTVAFLKYGLFRRQRQLKQQKKALKLNSEQADLPVTPMEGSLEQTRSSLLQRLQHLFNLDRQLRVLDLAQWLSFWLLVLAWFGGGFWVAFVSPYLIQNQFKYFEIPIDLLGIWFFTGFLIRISRYLIDRLIRHWKDLDLGDLVNLGNAQRRQLRASTIAGAAKGLATLVILLLGCLWALGSLGLPTASTVAILSVLALALSFGSRRLVEDVVNGFLILAEDQYAIGDVIDLGTASGLVENLNLRVTQLRSNTGELITIPNSKINEVRNQTRGWSRVDFSIDVAYQSDPDRAIALLKEVALALYHDPQWHDQIIAEPTVLGIDSVSHSGITLTTWIQTAPAQQWAVGREFRLRVRRALTEHGIEIGIPQQSYALGGSNPSSLETSH